MKYIISAIVAMFLFSCNQEEETTTLNLRFRAVLDETIQSFKETTGEGILVDSAVIILERISLVPQGSPSGLRPQNLFAGPYVINLLTNQSEPALAEASVEPGIYTGLHANLHVSGKTGYSVYISGTYTLDNIWWRFIYEFSETGTFNVENSGGLVIVENQPNNIWVMIDVVALLNGVDFRNAIPGEDNIIRIGKDVNPAMALVIQKNFGYASVIDDEPVDNVPKNDDQKYQDKEDESDNDSDEGQKDDNNDKDKNKDKDKDKDKDKNKDKDKDGDNNDDNNNDDDEDEDNDNDD